MTAATAALESSGYHPGPAERLGNFGNSEVLREVLDSSSLSDRQAMACALVESVRIAKGERGKPFTGLNRVPINWRPAGLNRLNLQHGPTTDRRTERAGDAGGRVRTSIAEFKCKLACIRGQPLLALSTSKSSPTTSRATRWMWPVAWDPKGSLITSRSWKRRGRCCLTATKHPDVAKFKASDTGRD